MVKNRNVGQRFKCWSKIEILIKHRNFGKNRDEVQKPNFGQKSNFRPKIKILVKKQLWVNVSITHLKISHM